MLDKKDPKPEKETAIIAQGFKDTRELFIRKHM